ncbi:DUF6518 family protein [Herbiconiux sp. CPCC 205763]|uniref:DUF6518 family protein n=1 Tax=Herbiconiux aconitum TaxID=2970913 RepID=A0ABT2GUV7_9MICO|nr:DUF6518 family protein [Herbiconiux aconitum]MCS5719327.1 DUF6518 family protein [Herbiconiux aconitum]
MTATADPQTIPGSTAVRSWRWVAAGLVIAAVGGLLAGGLTSFGQTVLPDPLRPFANSAGGWSMIAFALVWLGRARPLLAAVLGIVAFEALVEGYALVSLWRGYFYEAPFSGIFSLIGLVCGPVLGVAASLARHGSARWATLGVTPLVAVLWGEAVYALINVAEHTGATYWLIQAGLGVLFLVIAVLRRRPRPLVAVLAAAVSAAGAGVFVVLYSLL